MIKSITQQYLFSNFMIQSSSKIYTWYIWWYFSFCKDVTYLFSFVYPCKVDFIYFNHFFFIADISPNSRFSRVCFNKCAASYRRWFSVYATMFNCFASQNNYSDTNVFIHSYITPIWKRQCLRCYGWSYNSFDFERISSKWACVAFVICYKDCLDQLGSLHRVSS